VIDGIWLLAFENCNCCVLVSDCPGNFNRILAGADNRNIFQAGFINHGWQATFWMTVSGEQIFENKPSLTQKYI